MFSTGGIKHFHFTHNPMKAKWIIWVCKCECMCLVCSCVSCVDLLEMRVRCCQSVLHFPFQCTSVQMSVLIDFIPPKTCRTSHLDTPPTYAYTDTNIPAHISQMHIPNALIALDKFDFAVCLCKKHIPPPINSLPLCVSCVCTTRGKNATQFANEYEKTAHAGCSVNSPLHCYFPHPASNSLPCFFPEIRFPCVLEYNYVISPASPTLSPFFVSLSIPAISAVVSFAGTVGTW